ncbi:MAG TPA: porin family protein [Bacteroidales bacterium]|nr:porin family protein [Bacteroidales bacterium]
MKKLLLLASVAIVMAFNAQSQIKFGVRGAITSSTVEADKVEANGYTLESINDAKVGFQVGLVSQIQIQKFFIQPELLLATSGGVVKVSQIGSTNGQLKDQKITKVDIPVLVGGKMGPLRIGVGPVASMVIKSKSELSDINQFDDKFKKATWGYQVGAGLDIWKLALDVKYEGNLSRWGDKVVIAGDDVNFDRRISQWVFGVALFF